MTLIELAKEIMSNLESLDERPSVEQEEERVDGFTFLVSTDDGDFYIIVEEAH